MENPFHDLMEARTNCLTSENMFFGHINMRSIRANFSSLQLTLDNLGTHFTEIGVSETWINDQNSDLYNIEDYNLIETQRQLKKGGGVGIFLDNNVPYQIRPDIFLNDDIFESLFIEIDNGIIQRDKTIIIDVIYRPPGLDIPSFNVSMSLMPSGLIRKNKYC